MKHQEQRRTGGSEIKSDQHPYTIGYIEELNEKAYGALKHAQEECAEARQEAKEVEDFEKPLLAELFLDAPDGPVEERKMRALNHPKYRNFLKEKGKKLYRSDSAFYRLERTRRAYDMLRTKISFLKTVMEHDSFSR